MGPQEFKPTLLLTTTDGEASAKHLAQRLVEERLAACVSYHPMNSVYRWQGEVQEAQEFQLVVKCNEAQVEQVMERIKELHQYEVPEMLVLPISKGSRAYLSWMKEQL